ncbi:hypothetical protein SAMN05216412_11253 [Nitrosospira multiformis]|uniref:Uncharacterized protein n=1 Tax=Nitrosospira multiformis TaxID=1231 RepID=A0A1I0GA12_9PROT|nr:hypothetical protein SAMN05216412_11253 [Nitrosospira multiformis]
MRNYLKTLLFFSAFSPVLFTLAYVQYDLHGFRAAVIYLLVTGALGTAIPIWILMLIIKSSELISFNAKKVESNDFMLFVFVAGYFMPIINHGVNLDFTKSAFMALIFFSLFWFINNIPAHPVLRLIKYRFYKVESSTGMVYTLISKKEITDPKNIRYVKKISNWMLIEVSNAK